MTASKHMTAPIRRSMLPFAFKLSLVLTWITTIIVCLALVLSRALPNTGAIAFTTSNEHTAEILGQDWVRGTRVNLTHNRVVNGNLAFSPDGRQMIFTSSTGGFPQLFMQDVKCNGLFALCRRAMRQLTYSATGVSAPASWSPDGRQIAYANQGEIYLLTVADGVIYNLTHNPASDGGPVWSPDGHQIVFSSLRDSDASELYLVNRDGSHLQRITHNDVWDAYPVWSPDGTQLAFMTPHEDKDDLMLFNVGDGTIRAIAPDLENVADPIWSLDGRQIEFWVGNSQTSYRYAIDIPRVGEQKLMTSLTNFNEYFTLLPNGYFVLIHGANEVEASDLYLLDGSQIRLIAPHALAPFVWWP